MPRRRPPGIAIPVCQAGCSTGARYDRRSIRQILPSPLSKPAFPMFRARRASSSRPRSSFQSGPNIAGPSNGPSDRQIRQIALQASPRQNGLSYALPLIPRTPSIHPSTRIISLFRPRIVYGCSSLLWLCQYVGITQPVADLSGTILYTHVYAPTIRNISRS